MPLRDASLKLGRPGAESHVAQADVLNARRTTAAHPIDVGMGQVGRWPAHSCVRTISLRTLGGGGGGQAEQKGSDDGQPRKLKHAFSMTQVTNPMSCPPS